MVKFHFTNSKQTAKHFSIEKVIEEYQQYL